MPEWLAQQIEELRQIVAEAPPWFRECIEVERRHWDQQRKTKEVADASSSN